MDKILKKYSPLIFIIVLMASLSDGGTVFTALNILSAAVATTIVVAIVHFMKTWDMKHRNTSNQ